MYRVKQFFDALAAQVDYGDKQELSFLLTPPQQELFERMTPSDQRHSLNVHATLRQAGHDDPDLLTAALFHDVGKAAGPIWLWQRTLIVLLQRWAPRMLAWLSRDAHTVEAPWWRRGFVINRLHPELGAQWAAQASCSPITVDLIRRHQEKLTLTPPASFSHKRGQDQSSLSQEGGGKGRSISQIEWLLVILQWADGEN